MNLMRIGVICLAVSIALSSEALATVMGPGLTLDKLTEAADIIVKAKMVSEEPSQDATLPPLQGYPVLATKFQVISVIKGDGGGGTVFFRHYAQNTQSMIMPYEAQHYEFAPGRSYIVFAARTDAAGVYRQLSPYPTASDASVLLAADDKPTSGKSTKEIIWSELSRMANSSDSADVLYAVEKLDRMSQGGFLAIRTFDRKDVAEVIRPLLASRDAKIVSGAIEAAASRNPLESPDRMEYWLATVGHGHLPGLGMWDPKFDNVLARLLWPDLARIADSGADERVRASAILAMGRSNVAELPPALDRWSRDPQPLVRQAAIILLGDVPTDAAQQRITLAAHDASADARRGAAEAIGISQNAKLVPILGDLMKDDQASVRDAAAMSVISFSLDVSGDILRANVHDPDYCSVFVNALASDDPAPYLAGLEEAISKQAAPPRFWGGRIPAADSWDILFKYVQSRPADEFQSGKLNAAFDALESAQWYSSSEPRDLYALYVQHSLTDRAKAFRAQCDKKATYDMEYYFKQVDQSPGTYKRD